MNIEKYIPTEPQMIRRNIDDRINAEIIALSDRLMNVYVTIIDKDWYLHFDNIRYCRHGKKENADLFSELILDYLYDDLDESETNLCLETYIHSDKFANDIEKPGVKHYDCNDILKSSEPEELYTALIDDFMAFLTD